MLTVVPDGCPSREGGKGASPSLIDEIAREGAGRMGAGALRAGAGAYIARFAGRRGAGAVEVTAPGSAHPGAKKALAEILIGSPDRAGACRDGPAPCHKSPSVRVSTLGSSGKDASCWLARRHRWPSPAATASPTGTCQAHACA